MPDFYLISLDVFYIVFSIYYFCFACVVLFQFPFLYNLVQISAIELKFYLITFFNGFIQEHIPAEHPHISNVICKHVGMLT